MPRFSIQIRFLHIAGKAKKDSGKGVRVDRGKKDFLIFGLLNLNVSLNILLTSTVNTVKVSFFYCRSDHLNLNVSFHVLHYLQIKLQQIIMMFCQ